MEYSPPPLEPRAFIIDPADGSITIKKVAKMERHPNNSKYWRFELPRLRRMRTIHDTWNIFMSSDGSQLTPVSTWEESQEGTYFGRLNLQKLGVKHRLWRIHGILLTVYIRKP